MADKIRILVVDDSALMRKLIGKLLLPDDSLVIVGHASDGQEALEKLPKIQPDIILLDLEMKGIGGLETISRIREILPKLPILVFSSHTQQGGKQTLAALARGANDYLTKPTAAETQRGGLQATGDRLIYKIRGLAGPLPPPSIRGIAPPPSSKPSPPVEAIAIGASTGGPAALQVILSKLPANLPVPVLIVQHMPPKFTRLLTQNLARHSSLRLQEAYSDLRLSPGNAYIAPGGHHLLVVREGTELKAQLTQTPLECESRPSVNVLFRSLAQACPGRALGVVLTGMGRDGRDGSRLLMETRSSVIAQDEKTSLIWGMPGAVTAAGYAKHVLPLERIADAIVDKVNCKTTI